MGLLDDAIREHLELKRRRGADPTEVARQEAEALGPVRRGEVDLVERPSASEDAGADYEDAAPLAYDEQQADPPAFEAQPVVEEPAYEQPEPPAADEDRGPELDEHDHTPPHGDPIADDQHTREFTAADLEAATSGAPDEETGEHDELEDTPEFLQETPEHDRLWFEQKPPKDFDF